MISDKTRSVIEQAKSIFAAHKAEWEHSKDGQFVAIEPESSEFFFTESFDEAVRVAREKYPTRLSHTMRVGHEAVFFIGLMES